jgi:hypothetical protein
MPNTLIRCVSAVPFQETDHWNLLTAVKGRIGVFDDAVMLQPFNPRLKFMRSRPLPCQW